jgi:hypothetical protein
MDKEQKDKFLNDKKFFIIEKIIKKSGVTKEINYVKVFNPIYNKEKKISVYGRASVGELIYLDNL